MAQDHVPSANTELANIEAATSCGDMIAGMLSDLSHLTLSDCKGFTRTHSGGHTPPSAVAPTTHLHIIVHTHQGSSVTINATPSGTTGCNSSQGCLAGSRIIFVNPSCRAVTPAPTPIPAPAILPVAAAPAPGPDPIVPPGNPATAVATPVQVSAATTDDVPDNSNPSNGSNPEEDIYPLDATYNGKWYAVIVGHWVGVFPGWLICGPYMTSVPGNIHKLFKTCAEAYVYYLNKKIDGEVYIVPE